MTILDTILERKFEEVEDAIEGDARVKAGVDALETGLEARIVRREGRQRRILRER